MPDTIAIIGDGAMGTICAIMLAENGLAVRLWSAFPQLAKELASTRENRHFLPGFPLPPQIEVTADDNSAFANVSMAVSAVPTQFMRPVWQRLKPHCPRNLSVCSVAKGIENNTLFRPTQIIQDVLNGLTPTVAVLSGPCIAPEVARKLPATVTVASTSALLSANVQQLFTRPYFRVYTNTDVIGTEIAGATKNVIAIAAGILDGLSAGNNAKAALLTRGLVEITRLGVAMGANPQTFAGLAGLGDLVTTCISPVGRNRSLGEAIGKGRTLQQALASTESVVEGVATTRSVMELARKHKVDMPLTFAVGDVLFAGRPPAQAISDLMTRPLRAE